MSQSLQVLRTIDKFDKIGLDGVVNLLQEPEEKFGANLDVVQANIIGVFLESSINEFPERLKQINERLDFMELLDSQVTETGKTAWEILIEMPTNENETWENGGRPHNIGWALDDLLKHTKNKLT